ncbi:MAG TPA: hypothetical protein VGL58_05035 [Caulobacteraceae bacterium]
MAGGAMLPASALAAADQTALSPADQAAADTLASQIGTDVCQAGTISNGKCTPATCDAASTNLQQTIQQQIVAAGLQPNVVLAALRKARGLLPPPENPSSGDSCDTSAIDGIEKTVLAQIDANKPAGAGGGNGSQNGPPAFASSGGAASD